MQGLRRTYSLPSDVRVLVPRHDASEPFLPAGYGPHSLRHSLAVGMLDAGLQLEHGEDALQHAPSRSTEVYAKVSPAARAAYARRIEESTAIVKVK